MNLPYLTADKANHAVYGAVLSLAGALVAYAAVQPMWIGALILATTFAVAKEVYDRVSGRGCSEVLDAVATVAGAMPVVLVTVL